jgi:hypothetical protein
VTGTLLHKVSRIANWYQCPVRTSSRCCVERTIRCHRQHPYECSSSSIWDETIGTYRCGSSSPHEQHDDYERWMNERRKLRETCLTRPHHVTLLPPEGRSQVETANLVIRFRSQFNFQIKEKWKECRTDLRTFQLSQPFCVSFYFSFVVHGMGRVTYPEP